MSVKLNFLGNTTAPPRRDFQYKDIYLDIESTFTRNKQILKTNERSDLQSIYDIAVISNSIKNFLTTIPGQKLLNPFFGLDLRKYLFEPVNGRIAGAIEYDIKMQIGIFEPRIIIKGLSVTPIPEENMYSIEILFTPRIQNGNEPIRLEGIINSDGYFIINNNIDTPSYL